VPETTARQGNNEARRGVAERGALLRAQRSQRIDTRGSRPRNETRRQRDGEQDTARDGEGDGIARGRLEQEGLDAARKQ
jgi:hypothetical protein